MLSSVKTSADQALSPVSFTEATGTDELVQALDRSWYVPLK